MNEKLKAFADKFKEQWAKWSIVQKGIGVGILAAVIVAVVLMARVSSSPTTVQLFDRPITDETQLDSIVDRINQEGYKTWVTEDGLISVEDEKTARKVRTILYSESLVDRSVDPYSIFDVTNWTTTDYERNINKLRAETRNLQKQIESIKDIAHAQVTITPPKDALFAADKESAKVACVLTFRPGSGFGNDRKKIKGVQELIMHSVGGINESQITIQDDDGNILNDFEGMAESDRVDIFAKEQKLRVKEEARLRADVLKSLQKIFTEDRVRDLNVSIEWDMSPQTDDSVTYTPIMITEQDPTKPYDTTEKRDYLPISSQTVTREWTGTGYNPEGPAGVEGQNPPVYSDMSNVIGKQTETSVNQNNVMNTTQSHREFRPQVARRTVSVNIDGYWMKQYDKNRNFVIDENTGGIKRNYVPVTEEELLRATSLVQDAIGYNRNRGDSVTVTSIGIFRQNEFEEEDEAYFKAQQTRRTIIFVLIGIVAICIAFIVFRFISKELERKRRQREEELLRQQQAAREKALWEAKDQDMEVTMSVEERKRAELQENAIAMAKEHPEDVAMLVRTWLMEE